MFFVLLAQVPAPQLASAFEAAFFFLGAAGFAAGVALVAGAAGAAAATGASAVGVVAAAAVVAGATGLGAGAGVAADALAPLLAPQPAAEQDACPPAACAEVTGATSLACTGAGWLPPHAMRAPAPRVARTAAK
jgi:hypothetical protein